MAVLHRGPTFAELTEVAEAFRVHMRAMRGNDEDYECNSSTELEVLSETLGYLDDDSNEYGEADAVLYAFKAEFGELALIRAIGLALVMWDGE